MKFARSLSIMATALVTAASAALADGHFSPAVIFDIGGKFDRSFNQSSYEGAERFSKETGIGYKEFEIQNDAQREQALRRFAQQGLNPIVVAGFAQASAMEKVAAEFPDIQFQIIDAVVDLPNVRSVVFKEHEGSFLVGLLAGMKSESGTVGFVGGMDIPLIQKFACGYAQGVKAASADATVLQAMTGTTGRAWNWPERGGELAVGQIDQGADVVFHAAGATGRGVLQAAADKGALGIGVDANQNYLHPGNVLTSMLKRVDVAVYNAFKDAQEGKFESGVQVLGLAEDGVGYAVDENNESLLSQEMLAAVEDAKAKIIAGEIMVHDYTTDGSCPVN